MTDRGEEGQRLGVQRTERPGRFDDGRNGVLLAEDLPILEGAVLYHARDNKPPVAVEIQLRRIDVPEQVRREIACRNGLHGARDPLLHDRTAPNIARIRG